MFNPKISIIHIKKQVISDINQAIFGVYTSQNWISIVPLLDKDCLSIV